MRALLLCLVGLMTASSDLAFADMKLSTKAAAGANEVRYFTSIDGLMDGNADVVLKETRQGKSVSAAVLDVCYPVAKGSDRKDRFVANLAVNGQTLTGTTQSLGDETAGHGETGATADRRYLRVQGADQRRPGRDRGRLIGQFRSERKGISRQPVDRRRHHRIAEGFYRSFSGSRGGQGETGRGGGFPERPQGAGSRGVAERPRCHLRRAARRRANHQHRDRSGPRGGADRQGQIRARRGHRGLDLRGDGNGPHHPLRGRRLARWRQAQQGQARHRDRQCAEQDVRGKASVVGMECLRPGS